MGTVMTPKGDDLSLSYIFLTFTFSICALYTYMKSVVTSFDIIYIQTSGEMLKATIDSSILTVHVYVHST